MSKLRRALAGTDAAVVRDAGLYGTALGRWAGEPLADFTDQPWATVEAARLTELRLAALTEHAQLLLSMGRPADVIADLDRVVGADPTQETLAGLLMTALYQSGRRADALEVYARTRNVLDDELGLESSAALRALHQKVLTQDYSLAPIEPAEPVRRLPAARSATPAEAPSSRAVLSSTSNVPAPVRALIGRDQELVALRDLLTTSRLVSLVGPGGAGKTADRVHDRRPRRTRATRPRLTPLSGPTRWSERACGYAPPVLRATGGGILGQGSKSVERGSKLVGGGGPGARKTLLVGQPGPVVRVRDPCARGVDRIQLPAPEVPRRHPSGLGRCPGDPSALLELDNVVLPDAAFGGRHHEHVTCAADPLAGGRLSQVVVAVPAWLLSRIRDELEDIPSRSCDLATGADDAGTLVVTWHTCIEAPDASAAAEGPQQRRLHAALAAEHETL